jgi:hypothetical protein
LLGDSLSLLSPLSLSVYSLTHIVMMLNQPTTGFKKKADRKNMIAFLDTKK